MGGLANLIRRIGPYGAIELLVPGGSLIALGLWAVRHRSWFVAHLRHTITLVAAVATGFLMPHMTFADPAQTSGSRSSATTVPVGQRDCDAASVEQARALADHFYQQGDYQRAGNCYLVAREPSLADRAFLKSTGPAGAEAVRSLAQSRDEAKAQFQKIKEAFHHRP
jgi:hypothetical protein